MLHLLSLHAELSLKKKQKKKLSDYSFDSTLHVALLKNSLQTFPFYFKMNSYLCPSEMCFSPSLRPSIPPSSPFIQRHSLSRMRMSPTIHCANVIQFRDVLFAAAAKSHCYTLRQPIWEKKAHQKKKKNAFTVAACRISHVWVFLILRRSCSRKRTRKKTQLQCIFTDEPVSCGRERQPEMNPGRKKNIYTWIWCLFNRIINGQLQEEEEE